MQRDDRQASYEELYEDLKNTVLDFLINYHLAWASCVTNEALLDETRAEVQSLRVNAERIIHSEPADGEDD